MRRPPSLLLAFAALAIATASGLAAAPAAPKPLFRDPVYDGAADPVVVWNRAEKSWLMAYTNRRANAPGLPGVAWVHGTRLGLAESRDGGASWAYTGTAAIDLPPEFGGANATHWAPEIIEHEGIYHMFLTVVPGVFENWSHPRSIVHLTSRDLRQWDHHSTLKLASDRVIDACVFRLPDGTWRLWYNNERDHKAIYHADSRDLVTWTDRGKAAGTSDEGGEGPKVFRWRGAYWMVVDLWRGLGVYRSDDATSWKRIPGNLLREPGRGEDDGVIGGHPDVVVTGRPDDERSRAFLFYFTHPGRRGADAKKDAPEQRRSSIQVVELRYADGRLACDRDAPTFLELPLSGP
ncbi:MAG TPA: family 43 glycosylhydrolase [Opitutaceae bacterium]